MKTIRSKKYLAGSRGATCKLRIAGVCTGNVETTIPAHIRDRHTGRGIKASDLSVADSCFNCHEVFDRRAKLPSGEYLSDDEWRFYALRGLQDTLEGRVEADLLSLPQDVKKPAHARPTAKRKPKADRGGIAPRGFDAGHRPMKSRNNLRKEPTA